MKEYNTKKLTLAMLIYIVLQPVFDIFSNLYNYGYIKINFVTYFKPLFVFGLFTFLFFFVKYSGKKKHFIYYLILVIFISLHSYLLYNIMTETTVIIHELRFLINIVYFITIFLDLKILYNISDNKKLFLDKLKKVLIITIILYVIFYFLAVITDTSWLTYEFSDSSKLGYRGWYYSGQIFGHLLSIASPIFIYSVFKSKINYVLKTIIILSTCLVCLLIGTKVPYFIIIIVASLYIIINIIYKFIHKEYKIKIYEIIICLIILSVSILSFKKLPLYQNIVINNSVLSTISKEEDLENYSKQMEEVVKNNKDKINNKKDDNKNSADIENSIAFKYEEWTLQSLQKLNSLYATGKLHSSDNRDRQLYFMHYKFLNSTIPFQLVGLGYLNQPNQLSMERDIIMPLYSFGIVGFILITGILWLLLFKTIVIGLKNIKKINLETIFLAEGFCMMIFISFYAGYTYIYTQFSIILAIIMTLLNANLDILKREKTIIKSLNKITTDNYDNVIKKLEKSLKKNEKEFVVTTNPETLMLSIKDETIASIINDDNVLKIPDGIAIVKACKNNNMNVEKRITGVDLSASLLELANKNKKTLYLFGAKEEVIKSLQEKIEKEYKNIKILKVQNGYTKDLNKVKKDIITLQPDLCLVALGIPAQEKFIYDVISKVDKGIYMGVGGTFDVLSGTKKRAPKLFITLNIEWLYRIVTEPVRIKRFIKNNIIFILKVWF